jgi:hypothetical protein
MRLLSYINEADKEYELEEWWPLIEKNCMPYLKDIKKSDKPFLTRSMPISKNDNFIVSDVRKDRRPLDTKLPMHNFLNNLFYSKFKWRPRSEGLFCWLSKNYYSVCNVSHKHLIFPFGNYKLVYSPYISDLFINADLDRVYSYMTIYNLSIDKKYEENEDSRKIKLFDIIVLNKPRVYISRIRDLLPQDTSKEVIFATWKRLVKDLIDATYLQTTIDKTNIQKRVECVVKCNKYYAINIGKYGEEYIKRELMNNI